MNIQSLNSDLAEFEECLRSARGDRLRRLLEVNIAKIKTELSDLAIPPVAAAPASTAAAASVGPKTPSSPNASLQLPAGKAFTEVKGYSWTETDKALKLYINTEGCGLLSSSDIVFECSKKGLLFYTSGSAKRSLSLSIKPLKGDLDPACAEAVIAGARFKENEVILQIPKSKSGKWYDLIAKEEDKSTGKAGGDDTENPGDSLMKLMKKMYDDGDDKMKETIGKAMLESRQKQRAGGIDS